MKAQEASFLDILAHPGWQFVVPVFQRVYSWTNHECMALFEDIVASGKTGETHFLGTFLYSVPAEADNGIFRVQVIDGQQRITTITLMLMAFAEVLRMKYPDDADAVARAEHIRERFLVCADAAGGVAQPKLELTSIDRDMLAYLLGLVDKPEDTAEQLSKNLSHCKGRMRSSGFDTEAFWRGLTQLRIIAIELDERDAPQEAFESFNAKGKRLAVEDMVRNVILSGMSDDDEAIRLYKDTWVPLEEKIDAVPSLSMDDALCSWIASHHGGVYLDSKSAIFPLFQSDLSRLYGGSCKKLVTDFAYYVDRLVSDEQWRRDRMTELDRWLQGKPRNIISERKLFGD